MVVYVFQLIGLFHLSCQICDLRFVVLLYYLFMSVKSLAVSLFSSLVLLSSLLFLVILIRVLSIIFILLKNQLLIFLFPVPNFIDVTSF